MKGTTNRASNQGTENKGTFSNLMGATEMKIEQVKLTLTKVVENNSPAKFLGALVLGTALVAVAATGMTAGQVQASENQVSTQIDLGEEWFNPVTGEKNAVARSETRISSVSLGEEYFHPVTGEVQ